MGGGLVLHMQQESHWLLFEHQAERTNSWLAEMEHSLQAFEFRENWVLVSLFLSLYFRYLYKHTVGTLVHPPYGGFVSIGFIPTEILLSCS